MEWSQRDAPFLLREKNAGHEISLILTELMASAVFMFYINIFTLECENCFRQSKFIEVFLFDEIDMYWY